MQNEPFHSGFFFFCRTGRLLLTDVIIMEIYLGPKPGTEKERERQSALAQQSMKV